MINLESIMGTKKYRYSFMIFIINLSHLKMKLRNIILIILISSMWIVMFIFLIASGDVG